MSARAQTRSRMVALSAGDGFVRVRPELPGRRGGGGGARAEDDFSQAQDELERYFATHEAEWGLHGTGFEGGPGMPWDGARMIRAHARMWVGRFTHEALSGLADRVRFFAIERPAHWGVAWLVYTPRAFSPHVQAAMSRGARGGNLAGLLIRSRRLGAKIGGAIPLDHPGARLAWLEEAAGHMTAGDRDKFFDPLRREAEGMLQGALAAYEPIRRRGRKKVEKTEITKARSAAG